MCTVMSSDVAHLLQSVRNGTAAPPAQVPDSLIPRSIEEAYAIQDVVRRHLGPIAGWKVGSETPDSEPFCAPIHAATVFSDGADIPAGLCRHRGVEAELVYRFDRALPPRAEEWTRDEVLDAIGTIHPAIEILDSRFEKPGSQHRFLHTADQQSHGALIVGHGVAQWRQFTPVAQQVILSINNQTVADHAGGNSAGDPLRLLVWLANHASRRKIGISAGSVVTTGSTTGTIFVGHDTAVTARFPGIGSVHAHLS
ncbi:2-keto-4-pentenoate hydratase [Komagataeibacter nataicola]|uniref:2-keto-4-pentenoate hydratase n=1 Tax=Komagataeibacter nataicola TaxID=265960 RepID=A0A9N7CZV5_9PROT|nr:fumarylacetoacetate hydrolase family protein [Komagataeibacter nataicola]AQU88921.1 2-keto-4-pentenoate hydratase [Komagataeibacter nataicola]PYD65734.1 2-keto-4-pentenoate hydratase [Komagataeibacter nataicola]WEQ55935.1 2-keto-4-pentenoate hydratase [Komagataeibacter nataicola]